MIHNRQFSAGRIGKNRVEAKAGKRQVEFMKPKNRFLYICRGPVWVYILLMVTFPMLYSLVTSLRKYSFALPGYNGQFIGLANYTKAFSDSQFWSSMGVTLVILVITIPLQLIIGYFLAAMLNRGLKGTKIFTSIILFPMTIAPIVVGLIGRLLLMDRFGVISYYLEQLGLFNNYTILSTPVSAISTIIIIDIWHWTSFIAVILLAGLQSLPSEPYEAIQIDGGSKFQTTIYITIPLMTPIILTAAMLRGMDLFRAFDEILVLTGGGPGISTKSIEMFTYQINFHNWDMGYGASIGMISFFILLIASMFIQKLIRNNSEANS